MVMIGMITMSFIVQIQILILVMTAHLEIIIQKVLMELVVVVTEWTLTVMELVMLVIIL